MLFFAVSFLLGVMIQTRHESIAKAFRAAMAKSGLSLKEAAGHMDIDSAQLSRELAGVGNLSMTKVFGRMPEPFCQWFGLQLVSEFGLPHEVQVAQQIAQVSL